MPTVDVVYVVVIIVISCRASKKRVPGSSYSQQTSQYFLVFGPQLQGQSVFLIRNHFCVHHDMTSRDVWRIVFHARPLERPIGLIACDLLVRDVVTAAVTSRKHHRTGVDESSLSTQTARFRAPGSMPIVYRRISIFYLLYIIFYPPEYRNNIIVIVAILLQDDEVEEHALRLGVGPSVISIPSIHEGGIVWKLAIATPSSDVCFLSRFLAM